MLVSISIFTACASAPDPVSNKTKPDRDPLAHIDANSLFQGGVELAKQGDYIRAEQYYAAAMDKGYPARKATAALIEVCVLSSRVPAALQYAEPYLEQHPRAWSLRLVVASLYYSVNRVSEAESELLRVLEDAPKEPSAAHYLLALIYRNTDGATSEMKKHARRYLDLDPKGKHVEEAIDMLRVTSTSPVLPETRVNESQVSSNTAP